jgi:hypothetical protein
VCPTAGRLSWSGWLTDEGLPRLPCDARPVLRCRDHTERAVCARVRSSRPPLYRERRSQASGLRREAHERIEVIGVRKAIAVALIFLGSGAVIQSTLASTAAPDSSRIERQQARAKHVICKVFGPHCKQALAVSWCESRWYIWAGNGQYLGLFQMGHYARSRYGHGSGAWAQARAAYRYFVDSGRDWSPWSCKPY